MSQIPFKLPPGAPHCLRKRDLLNDKGLSPEVCREFGEKFLALGWWEDAFEFFLLGQVKEGLEKLKDHCLKTGDAYLMGRLGQSADQADWRRVGEQALAQGKLHFASRAFKMAGEEDKAAAVTRLAEEEEESPRH